MTQPLRLGVNIDHVATVRQARRSYEPSLARASEERAAHFGVLLHLPPFLSRERTRFRDHRIRHADLWRGGLTKHVTLIIHVIDQHKFPGLRQRNFAGEEFHLR